MQKIQKIIEFVWTVYSQSWQTRMGGDCIGCAIVCFAIAAYEAPTEAGTAALTDPFGLFFLAGIVFSCATALLSALWGHEILERHLNSERFRNRHRDRR